MKYIIGAGGVGSWLTPSMCLLVGAENVTVMDGDKLEKGNLNRQLFTPEQIGQFKAEALSNRYGCKFRNDWFTSGLMPLNMDDWLLVCVDNHPARLAALEACDMYMCSSILAANETHSAEAFYYRGGWTGLRVDPRVYYPEIKTDRSGDPRSRSAGCTGEFQEQRPQLVSANFAAASLLQQLYVLWAMERPKMDDEIEERLPHHFRSNLSRLEQVLVGKL